MTITPIADPLVTVKDLLDTDWVAANTNNVKPSRFSTGWFDEKYIKTQLTVSDPNELPLRGGVTGYSAIKGDGSGPIQEISGFLHVNVWGHRDMSDAPAGINIKTYLYNCSEEIRRIVHEKQASGILPGDFLWLTFRTRTRIAEPTRTPILFRYYVQIGYGYRMEP